MTRSTHVAFVLVFLSAASTNAQQRLYALTASEVLEFNTANAGFADILDRVAIPAELRGSSATSVAGGRYLAWVRQFPERQAGIVLFDTRARAFQFLPLPRAFRIVATDDTRPRLIVQATDISVFPARHSIVVVDGPDNMRAIDGGVTLTRAAYAAETARIFVYQGAGSEIAVFSANIGFPISRFPTRVRFPEALLTDRSGRRVVVVGWTSANELEYELLDGQTGASLATNRLPSTLLRFPQHSILDESRRRILTATAEGIVALSLDTLAIAGRTAAPRIPPHLAGRIFEVTLHARPAAAIGVALDRTRTPQSTLSPPRCLDAGLSAFDPNTGQVARVPLDEACPAGTTPPSFELVLVPGPEAPQAAATMIGRLVVVTWSSPAMATHYEVEAGSAPGLRDVAIVVTAATGLSGELPSGTYYVRVRALNDAAKGPYSNELRIVIP